MLARFMGLRAKATAMPVPSSRCSVCSAASSSGRNGSCPVSADHAPSYPASSVSLADAPAVWRSTPTPPSTRMGAQPSRSATAADFVGRPPGPARESAPGLALAPQVALQLGRDLVARRQWPEIQRGALGGVDVVLELADHGLVLAALGG